MNSKLNDITTEELIKLALNAEDEDELWEIVPVLQFRGNREVLEAAQQLCQSKIIKERKLGVDILGQLGIPKRTFPDESLEILFKLIEYEKDSDVLSAIGVALGHIHDSRAIKPLLKLKNHPSADVREGVVFGISSYEDTEAINTLIELSSDEDENVRNWATFGLGSLIDTNTAEIREALFQRLGDEDYEIRGEALLGLAIRKEQRVVEPLIKELSSDSVCILAVEAAKEIGEPKLYSVLMQLQDRWKGDQNLLADAINSCKNI